MPYWTEKHPINSSALNVSFGEIRQLDEPGFRLWASRVRSELNYAWQTLGIPPHDGTSLDEIEDDMRKISTVSTSEILQYDDETHRNTVVSSNGRSGYFLRSLFSSMSKSGDGNSDGVSIHDYLTANEDTEGGQRLCDQIGAFCPVHPFIDESDQINPGLNDAEEQ